MGAARSRHPVLVAVLLVLGAAAVGSVFLPWIGLSSTGISFANGFVSGTAVGTTFVTGKLIAGIGLSVLLTCGLTWLLRPASARIPGIITLAAGLVLVGMGGLSLIGLEQRFTDFAVRQTASEAFPGDRVREEMNQLFIQDAVDVRPGVGPWITLGVGSLAVMTGLVALRHRRRSGELLSEFGTSPPSAQDQSPPAETVSRSDGRREELVRPVAVSRGPQDDPRKRQILGDSWAG